MPEAKKARNFFWDMLYGEPEGGRGAMAEAEAERDWSHLPRARSVADQRSALRSAAGRAIASANVRALSS